MNKEYTLLEEREMQELNGKGKVYLHNKSGAKIFLIINDDINKSFSISFRTPSADDTGLPHILEHSVLCGSRKYPIKDPFVELAKGSLNTFLNAMTFAEKTMYPIASCNDKDYENLMDVYMDAVLYPNLINEDKILKQEGWHYELNSPEEEITYKGVVYNEMKGVFSSPEQTLFRKIQQSLFPDNAYHYESGGDPEYIIDLNQEQFVEFHKKYYHPSNSYIILYGKIDEQEKLEWLHNNYLKDFDKIEIDSRIIPQKPFDKPKEIVDYYPISKNEELDDKTYLSLNFVTGQILDKCEYIGLEILEYLLLEAPGAPLKDALLEAEIGKDIFGSYDSGILQPTFSIVAKNSDQSKTEKFIEITYKVLENIYKEGIDKKKLEAALNYFEFKIKESDYGRYPKGVIYSMKAMDSWLFGGSPFEYFEYNSAFKKLREGIENNCFNNMLNKYFLNNTHSTVLILKPDKEILEKKEKDIADKLKAFKDSLSKEQIDALVVQTKELVDFQNQEETKENIESIPLLKLEDINKEIESFDFSTNKIEDAAFLYHNTFTSNIAYLQLNYDVTHIDIEHVPYLSLLTSILGKMSSKSYEYGDLNTEINISTGGIRFDMELYGFNGDKEIFKPVFEISGKSFVEKTRRLVELFEEIQFNTLFSDKKRMKDLIAEIKSRMEMALSSSGHITAALRAESYFSNSSKYREYLEGVAFFEYVEKWDADFDEQYESIVGILEMLVNKIFNSDRLTIGLTCEEKDTDTIKDILKEYVIKHNKLETYTDNVKNIVAEKSNEGLMTSGKIQYVAKAGNYIDKGYDYTGELRVLQTILSLDYLWQNVRVKGGAYGCMVNFKRNGNVYFVSYRDPNLKETLEIFDNMNAYVEEFDADQREMRKYIIGTINKLDQPLTPSMKNEKLVSMYFTGVGKEKLQKERNEVLGATPEKIRELSGLIKEVAKQDNICVLGNENKIQENKEIFINTKQLFH